MLDARSSASRPLKQDKPGKRERSFDVNHQRRRDIARLVKHRHGSLAKTPADLRTKYAIAAAWHCPDDSERRFLMVKWYRFIPSDEFSSSSTNGHDLGLAPVVPSSGTNRQRHDLSRRSPSLAEAKPRQRQQRKAVQASKDILMPAPEPTMQAVEAWQIEALNKAFSSTNALH